jgi:hypothetical protein
MPEGKGSPGGWVGAAVDDGADVPVLDAQFSGEPQVGAVESDELGRHLLDAVEFGWVSAILRAPTKR